MKVLIIGIISILLLSCSSKNDPNKGKSDTNSTIRGNDSASMVVERFYSWYLDSLYENGSINTPDVIVLKDSVYSLDGSRYLLLLKRSGYFSNGFIDDQQAMIRQCNDVLVTSEGQKHYREAKFMAIQSNECDFMNYFPWIGGQGEELKKVQVLSSTITGDKAEVLVKAVEKVKVELIKENSEWKINKINIAQ